MARGHRDGPALDLFVELEAAHSRLRVLFDRELDDDVLVLAHNVLELAERTARALDQEELDLAVELGHVPFLSLDCRFTPAGLPAAPAGAPLLSSASSALGLSQGEGPEGV